MDDNVMAAMARWPDIPDVYGWLSLSEQGKWRLHPEGDAEEGSTGLSITSPQILQFIDRNYAADEHGRWFFQNGPQRVFTRLDAAPYVLHTRGVTHIGSIELASHNGLSVHAVKAWWLAEAGRLYAVTEHGPGLIAGRDLPAVLSALHTPEGVSLMSLLEGEGYPSAPLALSSVTEPAGDVLLHVCPDHEIPNRLGFVRSPRALGRISP
jgi:hypothetical protein